MEMGMYELVEKIWQAVGFIAFGGAIALILLLVFAPSIIGSRAIQKQLDKLGRQVEKMNEQLKQIAKLLEKGKNRKKEP